MILSRGGRSARNGKREIDPGHFPRVVHMQVVQEACIIRLICLGEEYKRFPMFFGQYCNKKQNENRIQTRDAELRCRERLRKI